MSDEPENFGLTAGGQVVYTLPEPGPLGKHAGSWAVKDDGGVNTDRYGDMLHSVLLNIVAHKNDIPGLRLGPFETPNEAYGAFQVNMAVVPNSPLGDYVRFTRMKMSLYGVQVRYIGNHEDITIWREREDA